MTAVLFSTVVFCWGFTWYAITFQLGPVSPEVSILWRFLLAAAVFWAGLGVTGRLQRAPLAQHVTFAAMGLTLFSTNFLLIYSGTIYVASGIVSVLFTLSTVFNALNQWLFLKRAPAPRTIVGGLIGTAGVALLFGEAMLHVAAGADTALGVVLVLLGTYVFSLGNLVSLRAAGTGVDLPNAIVRGMTWGALFLALFALAHGSAFTIAWTPGYLLGLAYLAIPGSIVAFIAYLALVRRIGADRAAYVTVLFPVVALTVSTVFEGYRWTPWSLAGLPLILIGNIVIFSPRFGPRAARA